MFYLQLVNSETCFCRSPLILQCRAVVAKTFKRGSGIFLLALLLVCTQLLYAYSLVYDSTPFTLRLLGSVKAKLVYRLRLKHRLYISQTYRRNLFSCDETGHFALRVTILPSTMLYSVILPTYNERENLPLIFYLLHKMFTREKLEFEVVVVDDSSPDGTLKVAQKLSQSYGHVTIVSRKGKLGLGSAYSAGLAASKGDRVILMDADLSHHPEIIPKMILKMKDTNCDIVTGTRYAQGGGVAGWDLKRKVTSRGANVLADWLLNPGVSDLTGSFRLYERDVLAKILPLVKSTGYAFQMEIVVLARKMSCTIEEVPISFVDRLYGESKLGPREIYLYLQGLLHLFLTT